MDIEEKLRGLKYTFRKADKAYTDALSASQRRVKEETMDTVPVSKKELELLNRITETVANSFIIADAADKVKEAEKAARNASGSSEQARATHVRAVGATHYYLHLIHEEEAQLREALLALKTFRDETS